MGNLGFVQNWLRQRGGRPDAVGGCESRLSIGDPYGAPWAERFDVAPEWMLREMEASGELARAAARVGACRRRLRHSALRNHNRVG
jgi:hypothetical protein